MEKKRPLYNPSLLLARIIFWKKILRMYEKKFSRLWLQWDWNLRCRVWTCQVSNEENKTQGAVSFHAESLGNSWDHKVNLLNVTKHLFRDGEINFLRDISKTTQCQRKPVLD